MAYHPVITPTKFLTATPTALGDTIVWQPAPGKRFRLMKLSLDMTGNADIGSAGVLTVTMKDGGDPMGWAHDAYISHGTGGAGQAIPFATAVWDLGNGYLSAAAGRPVVANLSHELLAGVIRLFLAGTEE